MSPITTEIICKRDAAIYDLIKIGGLVSEAIIRQTAADQRAYTLSFKLEKLPNPIHLSTFRLPDKPRIFKSIEVAIGVGQRFFEGQKTKKFVVILIA